MIGIGYSRDTHMWLGSLIPHPFSHWPQRTQRVQDVSSFVISILTGEHQTLPGVVLKDPDPEVGYLKSASEITREVIGGLNCWSMRFDLPAAEEDIKKCHVALTDGGVVLFEVFCLAPCFSKWLILMCFWTVG
jgi:hypothetical protein